MSFPNARLGVKILYHEAIVSMVFALVCLIEIICAAFNVSGPIQVTIRVLVIIALILSLVGIILKLLGVLKAAIDEPYFFKAFYVITFCAVFEIIGAFLDVILDNEETIIYIMKTLGDISEAFVMTSVIGGLSKIFTRIGMPDLAKKDRNMCINIISLSIIAILLEFIPIVVKATSETLRIIFTIFGIVSAAIEVLVCLNFQLFLKKVEKLFNNIPVSQPVEQKKAPTN